MPAGYSKRSLVEKLGIPPGAQIAILNAPRGYRATLGKLPPGVRVAAAARGSLPFIPGFTRSRDALESAWPRLRKALTTDGATWVSGPTKASGGLPDRTAAGVRPVARARGP